jgi:hypothetical protein
MGRPALGLGGRAVKWTKAYGSLQGVDESLRQRGTCRLWFLMSLQAAPVTVLKTEHGLSSHKIKS